MGVWVRFGENNLTSKNLGAMKDIDRARGKKCKRNLKKSCG